jgi:predicted DCC family thiol-disulfide oxidoreductase YuxK
MLVYDAECGFCARVVRFVLRRDPGGALRFASRHGDVGRAVRERHPAFRDVDSLLWVEHVRGRERVLARSDATLRLAIYLGGAYGMLGWLGRLAPRTIRDAMYGVVARYRRRLAGTAASSCLVPTDEERSRFLDE